MDYVVEQIGNAVTVTSRKIFGEYAIYCDKKFVAWICDNQLFIKETKAGKVFIDDVKGAPAYPVVKISFFNKG